MLGRRDLPHLDLVLPDVIKHAVPSMRAPKSRRWIEKLKALWGDSWVPSVHLGDRVDDAKEFKRIYNPDQVELVCKDAERIMNFSPIESQRAPSGLVIKEQWGLVGGTTWLADYATWFLDRDINAKDPTGEALDKLRRTLKPLEPTWGAYPLVTWLDPAKKKPVSQWFVFALFRKAVK